MRVVSLRCVEASVVIAIAFIGGIGIAAIVLLTAIAIVVAPIEAFFVAAVNVGLRFDLMQVYCILLFFVLKILHLVNRVDLGC